MKGITRFRMKWSWSLICLGIITNLSGQELELRKQYPDTKQLELDYTIAEATRLFLLGNLKESQFLFEKCLVSTPSCGAAHYMLSLLEIAFNDFAQAEVHAFKAYITDSGNSVYTDNLLDILVRNKEYEKAENILSKEINDHASNSRILKLIKILELQDKDKEAIRIAKKYNYPQNNLFLTELAQLYIKTGMLRKASDILSELIVDYPGNVRIANDLILLNIKQNKYEEAREGLIKYCFNQLYSEEIVFNGIRYFNIKGEKSLADSLVKLHILGKRDSTETRIGLINRIVNDSFLLKIYANVIEREIDGKVKSDVNSTYWIRLKASLLMNMYRKEEAKSFLVGQLEKGEKSREVYSDLLMVMNEIGDKDLEIFARLAKDLFYESPTFAVMYGLGLMRNSKFGEAVEVFNSIIEKGVDQNFAVQVLIFLGEANYRAGNFEISDTCFEAVLRMKRDNYLVMNNYSYYLAERNTKLDRALELSHKAVEKELGNATYLDTYAWILYKMGKLRKAKSISEKAIQYDKGSSAVLIEHYGDILYKSGREREAVKQWKKTAELKGLQYDEESNMQRVR